MKSKVQKFRFLSPLFIPVVTLALLSILLSGCNKSEKGEAVSAERAVSSPSEGEPDSKVVAGKDAMKLTEFPPLPEDIKATVMANVNASPQEQIIKINDSNITDTQKAQAFLLILPSLNRDGQREFARAAIAHVNDSTHVLIQQPLLDGKLDKQILSIFMTDTLKRPDSVKLPALSQLAHAEGNPMQSEAKDLLTAFSGQKRGVN